MDQVTANAWLWGRGEHVGVYANRTLAPVEVVILLRYRAQLARRTVDLGCGAGRILGYLTQISDEVYGVDLSAAMVDHCRRTYPGADVRVGDVRALHTVIDGQFDAIIAAGNLIDAFDDAGRRAVLAELASCLKRDGVLIFSSHNLAHRRRHQAGRTRWARRAVDMVLDHSVRQLLRGPVRLARRARNRRRLGPLQRTAPDYAIVNDDTFDYGLLHYYIGRDTQERQLNELGLRLLECLDPAGRPVSPGADGDGPWLHYVAQPAAAA